MSDEKNEVVLLTPQEAVSLLLPGGTVHVYVNPTSGVLVGADWDRSVAIETIESATEIQIGGDACRGAGHGLVVIHSRIAHFFECDRDKINALEAQKKPRASAA
jgi:hypothetical protein